MRSAMTSAQFCRIAQRLMTCPAAPYHEEAVAHEVRKICAEQQLACHTDGYGNIVVSFQTDRRARPLALAAHMDHPGFEIERRLNESRCLARFQGGVGDAWFVPGTKVRLMPGGVPARLGRRVGKYKIFELEIFGRTPQGNKNAARNLKPTFAVWDLPEFEVKNGRIHGRSCDDLIGVASILATLIELKKRRDRVNVIGLISRAEEIGFRGALTLAAGKLIHQNAIVVSLETSRELPPARMGDGVIIRVGDRTSIFNSAATRFLTEIASELQHRKKLKFQRALMSGGTCEATAYQEFGFTTCAVCVALGNYHNCAPSNRIRAEFISIGDVLSMISLLSDAARKICAYDRITEKLPRQLKALLRKARAELLE